MTKFSLRRKKLSPVPLRQLPKDELAGYLVTHQQWLESEESDPRVGKPADFSNADFRGHDFTGANLKHADFRDADLRKADFSGADLTEAEFRGANLEGANLSSAVGLAGEQLSDTNLRRAKLPENFGFEALAKVNEISQGSYPLFVSMLLACVYSWLTIASTQDPELLMNSGKSKLPIIDAEIPIVGFYWMAPLVLLGIYVYFHLNLQRLWEAMTTLPAIFPDGVTLDRKTDSWLLIDLVRRHYKYLKPSPPPLAWLQETLSLLLAWWVVPLTVAWLWLRFLSRHDRPGTLMHIALLTVVIWVGVASYKLAVATLRADTQELDPRQESWGMRRLFGCGERWLGRGLLFILLFIMCSLLLPPSLNPWLSIIAPLVIMWGGAVFSRRWKPQTRKRFGFGVRLLECSLLFLFISALGFELPPAPPLEFHGKPVQDYRFPNGEEIPGQMQIEPTLLAQLRLNHPKIWMYLWGSKAADLIGYAPFANFRSARVSTGSASDLQAVEGASLRNVDMRNAQCQGAFLAKADFDHADLHSANLARADLQQAHLTYADLRGAEFNNADLRGAKIQFAKLEGAIWAHADLQKAIMGEAGLQGANLQFAKLQGADLSGADLTYAQLQGANLKGAKFSSFNFWTDGRPSCADLRDTDLRATLGLTLRQIQSAIIDRKTKLPASLHMTAAQLHAILVASKSRLAVQEKRYSKIRNTVQWFLRVNAAPTPMRIGPAPEQAPRGSGFHKLKR